jgi:hypothetical protein
MIAPVNWPPAPGDRWDHDGDRYQPAEHDQGDDRQPMLEESPTDELPERADRGRIDLGGLRLRLVATTALDLERFVRCGHGLRSAS